MSTTIANNLKKCLGNPSTGFEFRRDNLANSSTKLSSYKTTGLIFIFNSKDSPLGGDIEAHGFLEIYEIGWTSISDDLMYQRLTVVSAMNALDMKPRQWIRSYRLGSWTNWIELT